MANKVSGGWAAPVLLRVAATLSSRPPTAVGSGYAGPRNTVALVAAMFSEQFQQPVSEGGQERGLQ